MRRAFAAHSAFFPSAERHIQGTNQPAVDPHGTDLEPVGRSQQAIPSLSPHGSAQSIFDLQQPVRLETNQSISESNNVRC